MYKPPTIFDFQRNLDTLIHSGEQRARAETVRIKSEFAARGMSQSTSVISATIGCFNELHKDITEQTMTLMNEFVSAELSLDAMTETTRGRLSNFATMLLATVPPSGFPQEVQKFRTQYAAVFGQRLDGALKDVRIGFVAGRKIMPSSAAASGALDSTAGMAEAKLADAVILRPSFMGMGIDLPKAWQWVRKKWQGISRSDGTQDT